MRTPFIAMVLAALVIPGYVFSIPPEDPEAKKVYDHNYQWLEKSHVNFIATNIRGENDSQYPERRQAALDILKVKRDLTTVPELMDELKRGSFLSGDICEMLGEWKARKAMPLLTEVSVDKKRPSDVRGKAEKAIYLIKSAPPVAPPPKY